MSILLHLGAHKTASTHLQQSLRSQQLKLRRARVSYLGPDQLRRDALPISKLAEYGLEAKSKDLTLMRDALARHRSWAGRIILSEENILGVAHNLAIIRKARFYPGGPQRLRNLLDALDLHEVTVFLAVRNPASFIVSAYSQRLYAGFCESFEQYLGALDPAVLQWTTLVHALCKNPRVGRCIVWQFEDYPAIVPSVFAELLPPELADSISVKPGVRHAGLSARAQAHVMAATPPTSREEGIALVKAARNAFPKTAIEPGFAPVSPDVVAACGLSYAADIARLAALPKVTLLQPPLAV
jgi:hypothetical protein